MGGREAASDRFSQIIDTAKAIIVVLLGVSILGFAMTLVLLQEHLITNLLQPKNCCSTFTLDVAAILALLLIGVEFTPLVGVVLFTIGLLKRLIDNICKVIEMLFRIRVKQDQRADFPVVAAICIVTVLLVMAMTAIYKWLY